MAKEYLDKLSIIMDQATAHRVKEIELECKHFFSGAALYYADGRMGGFAYHSHPQALRLNYRKATERYY